MTAKEIAALAAFIVGAVLGVWHFSMAMSAIFVFRNDEPITSWLAVVLGPGATIAGVVVASWSRFGGGVFLIIVAAVAAVSLAIQDSPGFENVAAYLARVTIPMMALGITFVALSKRSERHAT